MQKSLTGTSDDDRVTHIVLQGFETNGIRVLRRLNSIEGYVQTYVLFVVETLWQDNRNFIGRARKRISFARKKVNVTIQYFHL